jgi:hypothetical protein
MDCFISGLLEEAIWTAPSCTCYSFRKKNQELVQVYFEGNLISSYELGTAATRLFDNGFKICCTSVYDEDCQCSVNKRNRQLHKLINKQISTRVQTRINKYWLSSQGRRKFWPYISPQEITHLTTLWYLFRTTVFTTTQHTSHKIDLLCLLT